MARLEPLPVGAVPEVADVFETIKASGHYIPNSQLILQRKPAILRAVRALGADHAIVRPWDGPRVSETVRSGARKIPLRS